LELKKELDERLKQAEKWYYKYIIKYIFRFKRACILKFVKFLQSVIVTVYKFM
jgi:hypothetical protein